MMTRLFVLPALMMALGAGEALAQSAPMNATQACTELKAAKKADEINTIQKGHDKTAEIAATRKSIGDGSELRKRVATWQAAETARKLLWDEWTKLQTDLVPANRAVLKTAADEAQAELKVAIDAEMGLPEAKDKVDHYGVYGYRSTDLPELKKKRDDLQTKAATKLAAETKDKAAKAAYDKTITGPKEIPPKRNAADNEAESLKKARDEEINRINAINRKVTALEAFQTELQACATAAHAALPPATPAAPKPPAAGGKIGPILPPPPTTIVPAADALCGEIKAAATLTDVDSLYRKHHGTVTQELQRIRGVSAEIEIRRKPTDDAAAANPNQKVTLSNNQTMTLRDAAAQVEYQRLQFERQHTRWQDLDTVLQTCAAERKQALIGPTYDELLASIEENLAEVEKITPLVPATCNEILNGARQATAAADALGAEADALNAEGNNAVSGGAGAGGAGQPMLADASAAAAAVSQSNARAKQYAQAACAAMRAVISKGAGGAADLIESQRNRERAEQEVTTTVNALQQIRAAHAAAKAVQATSGTGVDPAALANRLNAAQSRLAGIGSVPAGLRAKVADIDRYFYRVIEIDNAIKKVTGAAPDSDVGRYATRNQARIGRITARQARLKTTSDCRASLMKAIADLQAHHSAADAKMKQAAGPVAAARAIGGTAASQGAIETLFNTARSIADQTTAEATTAVDCATRAKQAMAAVIPPAPPAPPPAKSDMMQGFNGTWRETSDRRLVWTISGEGLGANVNVKPQSNSEIYEWSATCRPEGTNVQNCTGQGVYVLGLRRKTFTIAIKMTRERGSISFECVYSNVVDHSGAAPYGAIQNGYRRPGRLVPAPR